MKPDALALADALEIRLPERLDILDQMLVDFNEVQNTLNSGFAGRGSGAWGFSMPATWTRSYARLNEALRELRRVKAPFVVGGITREPYWHLAEFYLRARRVQRPVTRKVTHRKGKTGHVEAGFAIVALRHEDVDLLCVRAALEKVNGLWPTSERVQPHYLTGADWERLLNPEREQPLFLPATA